MEQLFPLLQTVLWVALIASIVIRFHQPLYDLLVALHKRIEGGSTLKAGPFELGGQIQPQALEQQRSRASAEIQQLLAGPADAGLDSPPPNRNQIESRFFQAEDFALRALQDEFRRPINRQVTLGPNIPVDGAFLFDDRLYVIEVKYILRPRNAIPLLRKVLEHYASAFGDYRRRTVTVVLALVFQFERDVDAATLEVVEMARAFPLNVEVRGYALPELQRKFGAQSPEGG